MTLKWIEGFEIGRMKTELEDKYDYYDGPPNTGYSPRIPGGGNAGQPSRMRTPSLGTQNTWYIGFGMRKTNASGNIDLTLFKDTSDQVQLRFIPDFPTPTFKIALYRGATLMSETGSDFATDTWYYIELKTTVRTGTNGSYELRVNEVTKFSASSINLANAGSDGANKFYWGYTTAWSNRLDDVYILDDQGSINNSWLGDSQVEGIHPIQDGDDSDWTPSTGSDNYAMVDDPQSAYNITDYVTGDTAAERDLYEFGNIQELSGTIRGIAVINFGALDQAGSRTFKNKYKTDGGGTLYDLPSNGSPEQHAVSSTGFAGFMTIAEENPDTTTNWTTTDLNNAQFGIEMV